MAIEQESIDAQAALIAKITALHSDHRMMIDGDGPDVDTCTGCWQSYPCDTLILIREAG